MEELTVSVITPCRNEVRHIASFLRSLESQITDGLRCEFILADGMSDDGTREILFREMSKVPGLRVIDNPGRMVSSGLNDAISQAGGEFIVRMDVHSEYAPDYVASCVRTLIETGAENVGGPMRQAGTSYMGRGIAAAFHAPFSCGGARFHRETYEGWVDTVTYGCWRRETLLSLGMFDTNLVRNQDDELNLRLVRAGGRIWQSPRIVMAYHPRSSVRSLFRQYFQYGFWKVRVIRKHRIPASWRHLIPGLFVFWLLLAPVFAAAFSSSPLAMAAIRLWMTSAVLYFVACIAAAFFAARERGWDLMPILPAIFATYHFAYGIGFVVGCLYGWRGARAKAANEIFVSVTR